MLPCATKSNCPCEGNPVGNFSSEAPDKDVFLGFSTGSVATVPQPGTPFDNSTGYSFCESEESQEAADLCAAKGAIENNADNGNPSTPPGNTANDGGNWGVALYQNSEQSCTVDCPNGGQFTYVVPAGAVTDLNPTIVDRAAASLACKNANKFLICIGPLDNVTGVVGTGYFGTVVLTGSFAPYRWTAVTPLPAGLTLDADTAGDTVLSKTVGIIGTPTASGAQAFTLRATDRDGHYAERSFTITVTANVSCATILAGLSWNLLPTGPIVASASGASGTFVSVVDPVGSGCDFATTLVNNSGAAFDVHIALTWTGDGGTIVFPVDAVAQLYVNGVLVAQDTHPNGPFAGGLAYTGTFPDGSSIAITVRVDVSNNGFMNGSFALTCV